MELNKLFDSHKNFQNQPINQPKKMKEHAVRLNEEQNEQHMHVEFTIYYQLDRKFIQFPPSLEFTRSQRSINQFTSNYILLKRTNI